MGVALGVRLTVTGWNRSETDVHAPSLDGLLIGQAVVDLATSGIGQIADIRRTSL